MVFGEVAIGDMAIDRIEQQRFGERGTDAPDDPAKTLRTRGLRVEHATEAVSAEHAVDPRLAGEAVDAHFRKERAIAGRGEIVFDSTGLVMPLDREFLAIEQFDQRSAADHGAILELQFLDRDSRLLCESGAQVLAGDEHCRADRRCAPATARTGPAWEIGVAQVDQHPVHRQAEHLARDLADDGIGAGADIGHVGFDQRGAVGLERHPRARFGDIVDPRRAGHAGADPPFALAPLTRFARAMIPAERLRALFETFGQLARGIGQAVDGMAFGNVAQPQLDRIDPDFFGQHVHRRFERGHAHGLARRADRACGHPVNSRHFELEQAVLASVKEFARLQHGLGEALARQLRHACLMPEAGQATVLVGGKPEALAGFRAAHDRLEHLLTAQHHAYRSLQLHCRDRRRNGFLADPELGPEAAADIAGNQPYLILPEIQRIGQFGDVVVGHLK